MLSKHTQNIHESQLNALLKTHTEKGSKLFITGKPLNYHDWAISYGFWGASTSPLVS